MGRIFHVGAHGVGPKPMFWLRPTTKRSAVRDVLIALAIFALVCLVTGCSGVVEIDNGPLGRERTEFGPPWRVAPATRTKSSTTTEPCGTTTTTECEGGICTLPVPGK